MRVTEVKFKMRGTKRPHPDEVEITVQVDEGESALEAIRRAKATAKVALGEVPAGRDLRMLSNLMQQKANDLSDIANRADREVFA